MAFNGRFKDFNWRYLPYLSEGYVREYVPPKNGFKGHSTCNFGSWNSKWFSITPVCALLADLIYAPLHKHVSTKYCTSGKQSRAREVPNWIKMSTLDGRVAKWSKVQETQKSKLVKPTWSFATSGEQDPSTVTCIGLLRTHLTRIWKMARSEASSANGIKTFATPCQPKFGLDLQGYRTSAGSELNCATWNWSSARAVLQLFQINVPQIAQETYSSFLSPPSCVSLGQRSPQFCCYHQQGWCLPLGAGRCKRKLGMQRKQLHSLRGQLCPAMPSLSWMLRRAHQTASEACLKGARW